MHSHNSESNMVDVFIHQLPSSLPADGMHFFRRFKVDDVYNSLASLMDIQSHDSRRPAILGGGDYDDFARDDTGDNFGETLGFLRGNTMALE